MGFESEAGGAIPTGYESERVAGFDHDAKHGDPDERPAFTDPGAAAGLSRVHHGGGFRPCSRGALRLYRSHGKTVYVSSLEAGGEGGGAAFPGAGERLFAPTTHPIGQAR